MPFFDQKENEAVQTQAKSGLKRVTSSKHGLNLLADATSAAISQQVSPEKVASRPTPHGVFAPVQSIALTLEEFGKQLKAENLTPAQLALHLPLLLKTDLTQLQTFIAEHKKALVALAVQLPKVLAQQCFRILNSIPEKYLSSILDEAEKKLDRIYADNYSEKINFFEKFFASKIEQASKDPRVVKISLIINEIFSSAFSKHNLSAISIESSATCAPRHAASATA